jgi:hypothetical protein
MSLPLLINWARGFWPLTVMSQMNMPGKWLHPWNEPLPNTSTTQISFSAVRGRMEWSREDYWLPPSWRDHLRDLLDLFQQFRFVILEPEKAVARNGGTRIDLSMSLSIDLEIQAFHVWRENTGQLMTLHASLLSDEFFYKKPARSSCFSQCLGRFFSGLVAWR